MNRLASLRALHEATREIGLTDSLTELIDEVLDRARELIPFEHCALMLYHPERETLTVERIRGYGDRAEEVLTIELAKGEGLSGWAVENREAVRVGDVESDPRYVSGLPEARSNMAVPLVAGGDVAGALNVEAEEPDAFSEVHEQLLTVLGAQAALAIVAYRARRRLRRRIEQLDALHRISRLASGRREMDETLRAILDIVSEFTPEGHVAILLLDEDEEALSVWASTGYQRNTEDLTIPLGEGVTGRCAESGRTIVVEDVREFDSYIPGVEEGRSEVAIPLKVEGKVIGVLDAEARTASAYSEEDVRILGVVAQQIAAVIHTVRLHERARVLAITDPLTGLHNRRRFFSQLADHLGRAERYEEKLALVLLDCDMLKEINDRHGHLVGDRSLQKIAELLCDSLRESDEIARIGVDEFAALILQADEKLALQATERLRHRVGEMAFETEEGEPVDLSVSIGVALFPRDGRDPKDLLRKADAALYRAKNAGRNHLVFFEADPEATAAAGGEEGTLRGHLGA